jgi:hypothetical protein
LRASLGGVVKLQDNRDVLTSSALVYHCKVVETTWAFMSFVQKKKRANATTQFWYTDVSMIVLKRQAGRDWSRCECILQGVQRDCDYELFLDPHFEYCFIPFSYLSGKEDEHCGAQLQPRKAALFRFTSYSANAVEVKARPRKSIRNEILIEILHSSLLQIPKRQMYILGPKSVLLAISGHGCIYFVALNAANQGIMMKISIERNRGMAIVHGVNNDTNIIPSNTQCIVMVLTNDGCHLTPSINFRFQADSCAEKSHIKHKYGFKGIGTRSILSLSGELLCNDVGVGVKYQCSKGFLDERLWSD